MGRARFQARDAVGARQTAEAALAARADGEPRWSLGVLCWLTPNAPGTHAYVVTFAAWEARGDRFLRHDVHEREVWATDATSARRLGAEQVQSLAGYRPAWRVRQVAERRPSRAPAAPSPQTLPGPSGPRRSPHRARESGRPMDSTPGDREVRHRRTDEALTERLEVFMADRRTLDQAFSASELAAAVGIERFSEREAHLLLVALRGQGRAHCDLAGWHAGPPPG